MPIPRVQVAATQAQNNEINETMVDMVDMESLVSYENYIGEMANTIYNATAIPAERLNPRLGRAAINEGRLGRAAINELNDMMGLDQNIEAAAVAGAVGRNRRGGRLPGEGQGYTYTGWEVGNMDYIQHREPLYRQHPVDEVNQAPAPPAQPAAVERTEEQNFKREYYLYKLSSCFDMLSNVQLNTNDFTSVDPHRGRAKHSSYCYDYNNDYVAYYRSLADADKPLFMQMILNKYEVTFGPDFA